MFNVAIAVRDKRCSMMQRLVRSAFAQNNRYVTAAADIAKLGLRGTSGTTVNSDNGKYTLTVGTTANDGGYTLTATQNFGDAACGNLT